MPTSPQLPLQRDVVICGAGMAGLCAALAALEVGATVTVIEKSSTIGGSLALSGGLIWTFEDFDSVRLNVPTGNPALQELVVDSLPGELDWLRSLGVQMGPIESLVNGIGRRASPRQAIQAMAGTIRASGGMITPDSSLETLEEGDESLVVRVRGTITGDETQILCQSAVLCTGGFQGAADLVWTWLGVRPDDLLLRSNSYSRGDGLIAAINLGASLTNGLQSFYGHALADVPDLQETSDNFRGLSQYYGKHAVALNLCGDRFADESVGTGEEVLNEQLSRQPHARGFYLVDGMTSATVRLPNGEPCIQAIRQAEDAGAKVISAPTIDQLIARLAEAGLPARRVETTLNDFKQALVTGAPLYPPRAANRRTLTEPPFYAVPVRAAITFTCGGLAVDRKMRVLRRACQKSAAVEVDPTTDDRDHAPAIAGLFAAGVDVGNVSCRGYVGGLATALVTGKIAGFESAQRRS